MANFLTRLFSSIPAPSSDEKRDGGSGLNNPHVPLSLALASIGIGLPTDSNEHVSEQSSLEVPTVLACVRILSEGVGSLPLRVYEALPDRGRKLAKEHPLYRLLTLEPNDDTTAVTFWTTMMVHATLWQNAFAEIERNPLGQPIALYPRLPWLTKPIRQNGLLVFETTDTPGATKRIVKSEDMLHIVGFSTDGLQGHSLIHLARQTVGLALAASKYGARFYANNARPGGVIKLAQPLSPEDMARLRADIEAMQSGSNTHRVAVLAPGMEWDTISVDPVQSQYVETVKFTVGEIAALFRVPGYMVGALEKAVAKATVEAQNSEFLSYSLRPWLERIEQEVQRKLLPPVGRNSGRYTVRFYVQELLRADAAARNAGYTAGINGSWLSVNDVRELEDLPPIPGGDVYRAPLNMEPVGTPSNEPIDEEDDGEADDTNAADETKTRDVFLPLLKDVMGRIQARSKKDAAAFRMAFTPIATAMQAYLGVASTVSDDYFAGLANRCATWDTSSSDSEYQHLLTAIGATDVNTK